MIVDTSAILAILLKEPGWTSLYEQAISVPMLLMSGGTLQELLIVALRKGILTETEWQRLSVNQPRFYQTLMAETVWLKP